MFLKGERILNNYLKLPPYITIPVCALDLGLSMTTLIIYGFLIRRFNLSTVNRQVDEYGRVYIVYPIEHLAADAKRKRHTVINSMHELEEKKLVEIHRRGAHAANIIYVKFPESDSRETSTSCAETSTSYVEESAPDTLKKSDPNNRYNNRNNNIPYTPPPAPQSYSGTGSCVPQKGRRKNTSGSGMFAPIPDYENSGFGYGY